MSTARSKPAFGLIAIMVLLLSCTRMGEPDIHLVTSDSVSVFATQQESVSPSGARSLAVLEPDSRVPILDCIDEGDYSIYKVRLSDGRTGFVSDGDFSLQDKNLSDSAWCGAKPRNPEWQRGWTTCAGPEFRPFALNGDTGPGPPLPVFRINHRLVVAVPKKYGPNAGSLGHEPRRCTKLSDLPTTSYLYVSFQGNWSSGDNANDGPTVDGKAQAPRIQPDRVTVRIERPSPQPKRSAEERNQWEQIAQQERRAFNATAREVAGLKCADWCEGPTDVDTVHLRYWQRGPTFVEIHATYTSTRYGGLVVWWHTYTSDISHWREIDAELWRLVAQWSLLDTADSASGKHANNGLAEPAEGQRRPGAGAE